MPLAIIAEPIGEVLYLFGVAATTWEYIPLLDLIAYETTPIRCERIDSTAREGPRSCPEVEIMRRIGLVTGASMVTGAVGSSLDRDIIGRGIIANRDIRGG
jgi:hypothetical protein